MVAKSVGLGDSVVISVAGTVKMVHVIETMDLVLPAVLMDIQDPCVVKVGTMLLFYSFGKYKSADSNVVWPIRSTTSKL